jgi:ribosomal protein S18 acetylase RimI-like enzyme
MVEVLIRQANTNDREAVRDLVQLVVDEIYGEVLQSAPVEDEDWSLAWVADSDTKIVGIVLTRDEWISDLWVLPEHRGVGVGQRLLAQGEAEIMGRGHRTLRLRVAKSNQKAVRFYQRQDWQIAMEYPHKKLPVTMLEMEKHYPPRPMP